MPARPSRRSVVATAVAAPALAAAGCTAGGGTQQRPPVRRSSEVDPDVALLGRVTGSTEAMVALYEAALRRHRVLRADLRPFLAAHRAHARALGNAAPEQPAAKDSASGGSGRTDGPSDTDTPASPAATVRRLGAAERRAADDLMTATREAESGPFARLLASMAASAAQRDRALSDLGAA